MFDTAFKDRILFLTMARPPVNAINREWIDGFSGILDELGKRQDVAVVVVRSAHRVFSAGADLKLMRECFATESGPDDMLETVRRMQRLNDRIEALPQATIAEIGGSAFGGGLELALACDLRVAALDARLGLPEARLGLLPGAGGTQRLTRLCGAGQARRIILAAEQLTGGEARDAGLVQWAVPGAELADFTAALAGRVAQASTMALAACKRCLGVADGSLAPGMQVELLETYRLLHNPETRKRVSDFLDR